MYRLTSLGSPALEKVKSSDIMVMDRWGLQWETGISFLMNHKQVYHLKFTIKVVKKIKIKWKCAGVQCISPSVCLSALHPAWGWWTLWAELHSGPVCCPPEVRHRLCGHKPLRKECRCSESPLAMRHSGTYRREGREYSEEHRGSFLFLWLKVCVSVFNPPLKCAVRVKGIYFNSKLQVTFVRHFAGKNTELDNKKTISLKKKKSKQIDPLLSQRKQSQ